jgi:hypothetical protein
MSGRQGQRPVRMGELPPLRAETWIPELLRDYGSRKLLRADLEAARRAFVYRALDRKLAREAEGDRNARYLSAEELLTPVIEMLAELPLRRDCSESELLRLIDTWASHILDAAGTALHRYPTGRLRYMERPREAIDALKMLRNAARKLGPLAEQTLDLAGELLKEDTYVEGRPWLVPHEYLLVDKINAAIEALTPQVTKGSREPGGNRPRGGRIADQVARAYAQITSELPPTTNPRSVGRTRELPYHRLTQRVFTHYGQGNWEECARKAAAHLNKLGKERHLRTPRRGRPPL